MTRPHNLRVMGLKRHLEATKGDHNGLGYKDFIHYVEYRDAVGDPLPVTKLARLFSVTWITMEKWITVHKEEAAKGATAIDDNGILSETAADKVVAEKIKKAKKG